MLDPLWVYVGFVAGIVLASTLLCVVSVFNKRLAVGSIRMASYGSLGVTISAMYRVAKSALKQAPPGKVRDLLSSVVKSLEEASKIVKEDGIKKDKADARAREARKKLTLVKSK